MNNTAADAAWHRISKKWSFPDLLGESIIKELDTLVKPENDAREPCSKHI